MFTTSDGGVPLWYSVRGQGPPVLLVPGRGDSTDLYPEQFVSPLLGAGFQIIRYDPRDTGLSGDGHDTDTVAELTRDALRVLDACGLNAAHCIGFSMGGLILDEIARRWPERLLSVTFLSAASLEPTAGIGPDFFDMVGDDPVATFLGAMFEPSRADRQWVEDLITQSEARAPGRPHAGERHQNCAFRWEWPAPDSLADVQVRALVVHGEQDRKLPIAHALSHAATYGTTYNAIAKMGHLPRPSQWDEIAGLVADHLAARPSG